MVISMDISLIVQLPGRRGALILKRAVFRACGSASKLVILEHDFVSNEVFSRVRSPDISKFGYRVIMSGTFFYQPKKMLDNLYSVCLNKILKCIHQKKKRSNTSGTRVARGKKYFKRHKIHLHG